MTLEQTSTAALTLRVAEARVEDIGHAVARLTTADLARLGARPGDVLKITGADVESACKKAALLAIAEFHKGARGGTFEVREGDFTSSFVTRN